MIYIELPIWVAILLTLIIVAPTLTIGIGALIKTLTDNRMSRVVEKAMKDNKINFLSGKRDDNNEIKR